MIDDANLLDRYLHSRRTTERLCAPLVTADYVVQAMPDAEIVALGQTPGQDLSGCRG